MKENNNGENPARWVEGKIFSWMENEDKYQAFDNLKQLLHHYGNALVTKEAADGLEMRRANKVSVGAVYVGVGNVQRLRRKKDTEAVLWRQVF